MGVGNPLMQPQGPVVPSGLAPSPMQHQQVWQPAARPVTDFPPGLWGSQQQNQNASMRNGYPFCRYYSTKTSRAPRKLIRFHGQLAGVPVHCLYDPGADLNFLVHSVAESNHFTLWNLDEPTACKGGLNGGPQLPISQEVKGLPLCIQGFNAPLDLTVVDLDDDYDVVLGMPFCEEYIPIPHYRKKALTIPACESPTGRDLLLLDNEEYPAKGEEEDFFSQRELRRLMKRPSSRVHLFRLEAVRKGGLPGLPPHRKIEGEIKLEAGHSPLARAPYRLLYGQLDELRRQLDLYLEKGHIRPSTSPYAAPVLFVQKADGAQWIYIDFTGLNKITVHNKFPIPHPEELLSRLHGTKFFSSLDLRQYFHQTRIKEGDEEKTAFVIRYGSFEWLVIPFGLCKAPSISMHLITDVLRPLLDKCVVMFIDDVFVFSRTPEEHIEHINQVLSFLREHQLYVKVSKCAWLQTEVKFLGLVVDEKGVRPSHEKMQGLTEFAQPTDRTSLHQFLGLANWFHRFVPRFSFFVGPLTFLLQGNVLFEWKTTQSRAFTELKKAVQEHATLVLPDPSKPVILVPDASQSAGAIGAVALQKDCATRRYRPFAFGSRRLISTEAKYPVRELEFLTIVHFAKVWRHFLSSDSEIWTDHQSLTNFSHRSFEFCSLRVRHWIEFMQELGITPKYIPGRANIVADALSRNPPAAQQLVPSSAKVSRMGHTQRLPVHPRPLPEAVPVFVQPVGSLGAEYTDLPDLVPEIEESQASVREGDGQQSRTGMELQSLTVSATQLQAFLDACRRGYSADPFFRPVFQHLSQQHPPALTPDFALRLQGMSLRAGFLYFEGNRLCVPRSQQGTVMAGVHSPPHAAHFKMGKTYQKVASLYYWPKIWSDEGFDAILVVLCRLIKAVVLIPTHSTAGAEETARIYRQHVLCKKGFQRHIVCDRDPRFVAYFWQTLHASSGSEVDFATASHHDTAGATERMNRTLEEALRCLVDTKHSRWSEFLCNVEFAYNSMRGLVLHPSLSMVGSPRSSPLLSISQSQSNLLLTQENF
uniref:Reverse transcriptase n=1 Tax=Chromera velia CCMP2878 TaxID=1169474 RepID=A0A0G4GBQ9_9ALVE|eukprot:Cvel_4473.t1-p1 / transcript=Cvel_4473.t1 / gene=Cvel_4473 / organism=Chromera_velia_CCMP2878 / gene_product=Retrotransposable element Tf2 155 kDa protein type, putative / transcript_product=Retrotransposable element Tf2 155 kDa protein type, putative / location=Cvel_scaffold195:101843-105903(-) / protein_length=1038 / sequence_SO=supercontig / SO=protein_coding / is_pseudo=false